MYLLFRAIPWHMEVPRLGVQSELQLMAHTTATATPDPSCICDLHHSSWQCQIRNPLSKAGDRTSCILVGFLSVCVCVCVCLFRATLWHTEVPRLGVQSELRPPAYTTATATPDPSRVCHLRCSSCQHRILSPLIEARDQTPILTYPSRVCFQ